MLAQASISVPSTEKCSLDSSLRTCGRFSTAGHELARDIAVEQPVPVLAEHRRIPHRIVRREPDEPAEQQIVVELLHQLPFRAHRVERLQQQRPQQPLRRDRRSAVPRIKLGRMPATAPQRRIDKLADRPQRMVRRNARLQPHIAEKTFRAMIFAAHRIPQSKRNQSHARNHTPSASQNDFFSSLLVVLQIPKFAPERDPSTGELRNRTTSQSGLLRGWRSDVGKIAGCARKARGLLPYQPSLQNTGEE